MHDDGHLRLGEHVGDVPGLRATGDDDAELLRLGQLHDREDVADAVGREHQGNFATQHGAQRVEVEAVCCEVAGGPTVVGGLAGSVEARVVEDLGETRQRGSPGPAVGLSQRARHRDATARDHAYVVVRQQVDPGDLAAEQSTLGRDGGGGDAVDHLHADQARARVHGERGIVVGANRISVAAGVAGGALHVDLDEAQRRAGGDEAGRDPLSVRVDHGCAGGGRARTDANDAGTVEFDDGILDHAADAVVHGSSDDRDAGADRGLAGLEGQRGGLGIGARKCCGQAEEQGGEHADHQWAPSVRKPDSKSVWGWVWGSLRSKISAPLR